MSVRLCRALSGRTFHTAFHSAPIAISALLLLAALFPFAVASAGSTPAARGYHRMAFDSESDRVILFSGELYATVTCQLSDTWGYDVSTRTWNNLTTAPFPVCGDSMAYDRQSDRIILFDGERRTWSYDYNSNTWRDLQPATSPPTRFGDRMAYDAGSDRVILFGGCCLFADTWAYDYETNTWVEMHPESAPPARDFHGMAYDVKSDRVVLFGGGTTAVPLGDTWTYDFDSDTWEQRHPSATPSGRVYHAMAYDAGLGRIVLFGGAVGLGEVPADDTWSYDSDRSTWTKLAPCMSPSPRGWHDMVYDDVARRIVLFGGGPNREAFTNETWLFDNANNTWIAEGGAPPSCVSSGSNLLLPTLAAAGGAGAVVVASLVLWNRRRRRGGKGPMS